MDVKFSELFLIIRNWERAHYERSPSVVSSVGFFVSVCKLGTNLRSCRKLEGAVCESLQMLDSLCERSQKKYAL